ncbi:ATP-binding protein [soil metagenome]
MSSESSFAGKFLRKIKKIDTEQIEQFLAQVLREKAFLEVVFDSLTEGVIVTERGMKVVFLNETARQFLGVGRGLGVGQRLDKLLKSDALRALSDEFQERMEPIRDREINVRGAVRRSFSVTIAPIENEDSLTTHAVWIFNDSSGAQRLAEERRQIGNIESLATLTAGVAHEVKNPLNSMGIHAQIMEKTIEELRDRLPKEKSLAELSRSTEVILEEIQRLARIVDDFIGAVRPVHPEMRKASLNDAIQPLAELIAPECGTRGIELTLDLDPEIPPLLFDTEQIQQALLNILKNAMEAIDKPEGVIIIRTRLRSDHALIEIEDNGRGISEKDRLKIFEPYYTTKFSGTGLGLMVVYRIIRAHEGAVALASEPGRGAVFSVALPLDERPVRMLGAQIEPVLERLDAESEIPGESP